MFATPAGMAIEIRGLNKTFSHKPAISRLNLEIGAGEMVALIGASGSGKSTLLRHIAGLSCCDKTQGGQVHVLGQTVQSNGFLSRDARRLRARVGYIFQQFNLVDRLSVLENTLLGFLGQIPHWRGCMRLFSAEQKELAMEALARVGLAEIARQRASTLSGGQQQRVAIARALTQKAEIILADEPIASLDPESARKVMEILESINARDGKTIVVTLHQVDYALRYCRRAVALKNGQIVFDGDTENLNGAFLDSLYSVTGSVPELRASGKWRMPPGSAGIAANEIAREIPHQNLLLAAGYQ
ncbi:MAG: phosphonate ABC transporter ATP-binding protein [Zoogloeaceae bacterium]|jgi:phosphonate transport system ATP-binding protein|nr:phosphonate ABC transporter ATP-binding protein [Zoogloeaceae bacterium]